MIRHFLSATIKFSVIVFLIVPSFLYAEAPEPTNKEYPRPVSIVFEPKQHLPSNHYILPSQKKNLDPFSLFAQNTTTSVNGNVEKNAFIAKTERADLENERRKQRVAQIRDDQKNDLHKYFGYATLALGFATMITAPDDDDGDDDDGDGDDDDVFGSVGDSGDYSLHQNLAYATVISATTTVMLGIFSLSTDIYWTSGWTQENYHAIFGTLGAALMIVAVESAPGDSHSDAGKTGGIFMSMAIITIYW